jgi:CBS domain containing-hemolysin-like protein
MRAKQVAKAVRSLSFQLSGAQLGITLTALLTGYLASPAIAHLIEPGLRSVGLSEAVADVVATVIALLFATLFTVLFGELVPKNAALAIPMPLARWAAPVLRIFSAVFRPVIVVLNGTANAFVRLLGIEPQEELASARSPEELGLLAAISARAGALPSETATLLQRTIRFGDKRAAEAMTPRVDVVGLPTESTVEDLLVLALDSGHTRFPIYDGTLDTVVGIAAVTDALQVPAGRRGSTGVRRIAREPLLVPQTLELDTTLSRLQDSGTQMAVVVDEYGGTDGIVTVEDLAEELVGEIDDEFDEPEIDAVPATATSLAGGTAITTRSATVTSPLTDRTALVNGLLREDELAELTGFRLPDGPFETLAGFLMARLGHIPTEGEKVTELGWEFVVTSVERHRVEQVRVLRPEEPEEDENGS